MPKTFSQICTGIRADINRLLNKVCPQLNITLQESRALEELKRHWSRVILMADKGVAMVVIDRQDYISKAQELIGDQDTYRPNQKTPPPSLKN